MFKYLRKVFWYKIAVYRRILKKAENQSENQVFLLAKAATRQKSASC